MQTNPHIEKAAKVIAALYDAIPEGSFPTGGIPNGHLYTHIMDRITLETYTALISVLQRCNLITIQNHYITRTHPSPPFPEALILENLQASHGI